MIDAYYQANRDLLEPMPAWTYTREIGRSKHMKDNILRLAASAERPVREAEIVN